MENNMEAPQKNKNKNKKYDPATLLLGIVLQ
jgi:hypothetical protein